MIHSDIPFVFLEAAMGADSSFSHLFLATDRQPVWIINRVIFRLVTFVEAIYTEYFCAIKCYAISMFATFAVELLVR